MLAVLSGYFVNGFFQDVSVIPMINAYLFFFAGLTSAVEDREEGRCHAMSELDSSAATLRDLRRLGPQI